MTPGTSLRYEGSTFGDDRWYDVAWTTRIFLILDGDRAGLRVSHTDFMGLHRPDSMFPPTGLEPAPSRQEHDVVALRARIDELSDSDLIELGATYKDAQGRPVGRFAAANARAKAVATSPEEAVARELRARASIRARVDGEARLYLAHDPIYGPAFEAVLQTARAALVSDRISSADFALLVEAWQEAIGPLTGDDEVTN